MKSLSTSQIIMSLNILITFHNNVIFDDIIIMIITILNNNDIVTIINRA